LECFLRRSDLVGTYVVPAVLFGMPFCREESDVTPDWFHATDRDAPDFQLVPDAEKRDCRLWLVDGAENDDERKEVTGPLDTDLGYVAMAYDARWLLRSSYAAKMFWEVDVKRRRREQDQANAFRCGRLHYGTADFVLVPPEETSGTKRKKDDDDKDDDVKMEEDDSMKPPPLDLLRGGSLKRSKTDDFEDDDDDDEERRRGPAAAAAAAASTTKKDKEPVRVPGAHDSLVFRSLEVVDGCVAYNFLFRVSRVCAKLFVLVDLRSPDDPIDPRVDIAALKLAQTAVARCVNFLANPRHNVLTEDWPDLGRPLSFFGIASHLPEPPLTPHPGQGRDEAHQAAARAQHQLRQQQHQQRDHPSSSKTPAAGTSSSSEPPPREDAVVPMDEDVGGAAR